ncbi:hypothetical protein [Streptomyces ardesiacus]|uniref:Barstar (barnase inhibitor) domain-containing protein n=1 Tax=Streptomyces ardesiacus TaxID=285564 RepID=A0ABW8H549_9ACTN
MEKVGVWVADDRFDLTALNVAFAGLPVVSASVELVNSWSGDLEELAADLLERFADDVSWCRVANDVHSVTEGSAEVRLTPRPDDPGWHAELFHAEGWKSQQGARIPAECRWQYARYADRRHEARESCLEVADLRAAAAKDGAAGVDNLVRHQQVQLAEWYAALDEFISSVHTAESIPEWAVLVAKDELMDWHRTREYLTSAVVEYHRGDVGPRPDTVFGNLCFRFSKAELELAPSPAH